MKFIKLFALLLFSVSLFGQVQVPTLEDLPKKIQRQYQRDVKKSERAAEKAERDGFDIIPDPIETPVVVPTEYGPNTLKIQSWQTNLQRVDALIQRMQSECTYPIHYRISDSGVDQSHPELVKGFTEENNWTTEDDRPGSHGTHVAGDVIQFIWPLVETGVATYGDDKSLLSSGSGSFAWAVNMFNATVDDTQKRTDAGQTVIWNCSWGGGTAKIPDLEKAMLEQQRAGGIIVAAAGNSGQAVGYPGNSDFTFAVSSLDESLTISSFSSRGPEVDGCAGGRGIYSTLPGNKYGLASGTSMASPSWAAIFVGIARSKWGPDLLPDYDALKTYYRQIATQVGDGNPELYGAGYPYIEAILNTKPDNPDEPDPEPEPEPDPDPTLSYVSLEDGGFVMRYRYENSDWNIVTVEKIEVELVGEGTEDQLTGKFLEWLPTYFQGRGIGFSSPDEFGGYGALFWTGKFLTFIADQNGYAVEVTLTGWAETTPGVTYVTEKISTKGSAMVATRGGSIQSLDGPELISLE